MYENTNQGNNPYITHAIYIALGYLIEWDNSMLLLVA